MGEIRPVVVLCQHEPYRKRMPMDEASTFGIWLKLRRKTCDLTQEQLAEQVGCAAETIRKIEADARRPSRAMAERVVQVLGVPAAERAPLVRWAREPQPEAAAPAIATTPVLPPPVIQVPLLQTKLTPPHPRSDLVPRSRLLELLDAGMAGRVTVIAAPPGSGKTTLLADWLAGSATNHPRSTAWLSLDAGDNDPAMFLRYLIAAFQRVAPNIGTQALHALEAGGAAVAGSVLPLLLDELRQLPEHSLLVLDDYHDIDTLAIHDMLQMLVEHTPPNLHLIIASRADPPLPLARLRVRRELREIRAADLRFTRAEAAAFLQDVMQVPLAEDTIAALEHRTEGWVAGLQLAALSLQGQPSEAMAAIIERFTGSHYFLVDYFADEVLLRLPGHLQTFLLHTSILNRLCDALCDAVLADATEAPTDSRTMLAEIERKNLFLVSLDTERRWFRFHQLFADVLRVRLLRSTPQAVIQSLHQRASRWFAAQHLLAEAFPHAVAAQDWQEAAHLIEQMSGAIVLGNMQQHQTLRTRVAALPDAVVRAHPRLCLLSARLALLTDPQHAETWLAHAEHALAGTSGKRHFHGEIAALRAGLAASQGAPAEAVAFAQQALAELDPASNGLRGEVMEFLTRAYLAQHDVGRATEALTTMARLAHESGDQIATFVPETNLAFLQRLQGNSVLATRTCEAALERAAQHNLAAAPDTSWLLAAQADLQRERNELDAALLHAQDAVQRARLLVIPNLRLLSLFVLARVLQAQGEPGQVQRVLQEMRGLIAQFRVVALPPLLHAFEAQNALQVDDLAAAQAAIAPVQGQQSIEMYWISPILATYACEHLALARAQVLAATGRATGNVQHLEQARALLVERQHYAEQHSMLWLQTKTLAVRALVEHALGDQPLALRLLEQAVTLAAPAGYCRVFLDEGQPMARLLALLAALPTPAQRAAHALAHAFPGAATALPPLPEHHATAQHSPQPAADDLSAEPLTTREQEILRMLDAGRSSEQIAQHLVIAPGTLKRHIANMLGKLQVHSRVAALARARELGLL